MHMSRMSTVLAEERGNNPFSRFRHKSAIDHQDIDSQESDLILADVLCQELGTLECCTRAEPTENMFETRKTAYGREDVISEPSVRCEHHCRTEVQQPPFSNPETSVRYFTTVK